MQSLWSKTINNHHKQTKPESEDNHLPENLHVQNVVIGAGITGILTAYLLQKKGQEVIILEADKVASGQTKNTTAKITAQHGPIYHQLLKKTDAARARGYYEANAKAIDSYEEIIEKEEISCHFKRLPAFLYATSESGLHLLQKEDDALKQLGIESEYMGAGCVKELPFPVRGALRMDDQAQFHPLKFVEALAGKLTIYEQTKVMSVYNRHLLETSQGVVTAEHVIFACHYPFLIKPGYYFARQHQSRSYALALEGEGVPEELAGMYYGVEKDGISLRSEEGRLIFGMGDRRTGNVDFGYGDIRRRAKECYPKAKEVAVWAAQDCMPHDGIPYIGNYAMDCPDWYVATGFQKWGMTSAMVAATLISEAITGGNYPYRTVFAPQRWLLKAAMEDLIVDAGVSAWGLGKGLYVEQERVCTHMGCALKHNKEEGTWECACHGSRFAEDGSLLDGPAQTDLVAKP